jgi:flagellar basal-body rod protein FlgF
MDRMVYIAMSGANETMLAQANTSHNLANVSTPGFRADLNYFRSKAVEGEGWETRVFGVTEGKTTDFKPGTIQATGRDLDVSVMGEGWFAVQAPDGNEAYTRRGDLQVDANGLLTTSNGLPMMGEGGPIAIPPAETITIGSDGTISIIPLGADAKQLAVIDRIKMVAPQYDQMEKDMDGLMRLKADDNGDRPTAEADASIRLQQGMLEGSNVNAVNEMVNMIELQRRFEMQVKMMKTAKDMADSSATIMRSGG